MPADPAPPAPAGADVLLVTDPSAPAPAGLGDGFHRTAPAEAATVVAGRAFAAVVLDARRDPEAARRVLEAGPARHVPVIVLAAAGGLPAAEAYRLGAVDHLAEPFDPGVLRAKLAVFAGLFRKRRRAERRERWLRAVTDSLPTLVSFVAADQRYRFANRAYRDWFGVAPEAVIGRHVRDVLGEDVYRHRLPHITAALRGEPGRFEGPTVHRTLGARATEVTYVPHVGGGAVDGFFVLVHDVTDRKRAAEAVRRSEERYRRLVEQSPLSIQVLAPDGRTLRVNRAWEDLWGGTRGGHPVDDNVRTDPRLAALGIAPLVERAFAGEAVELPVAGYTPARGRLAGRRRWVRGVAYPVKDDAGRVDEVVLIHQDVTDQRAAAEAHRFLAEAGEVLSSSLDSEETLAALARLVVPAHADWCTVHVADPGGPLRQLAVAHADPAKVEWARDLARRYPPDPDAPRGAPAVVRTGEPELIPDVTDEMLVAGARDADHLAILRGVGLRSVVIAPLAARGRTFGAITFVAAESGRRYGPDDLRLAVDLGRRAGLAVDNARLFGESQEALRLLGLLVEASGRLTGSLDPPAVRAAVLDLSRRLVAADAHAIWRYDPAADEWAVADSAGLSDAYVREQGRVRGAGPMPDRPIAVEDALGSDRLESRKAGYRAEGIASLLAAPLHRHGAVAGTLVFYYRAPRRFDDVTVRVAAALADLAGAALGTAELYAREAESRRRAEEADRRKDEFLATLAHELRNPLAPLRNGLAILRLGPPAGQAGTLLGMMDRQLGQLVHLIDDLLDVARVTSGKIVLRPARLDLRAVVEVAVETSRPAVEARRHELAVRLPADPLPVTGDRVRLAQVLTNLLTNSAKYTHEGGRIEVSADRDDGAAVVRVADTGVGIPADMLGRVFEVFTQVGRSTDRSQGGLGLGLALVRSLVEMHGGAVWAESAGPNLGSTFVVRLPLADGPPDGSAR